MPTFSNQATLSYNSATVASNIVTGEVVSSLSLTKTALSATYAPGDVAGYAVSIVNTGSNAFSGLTLTDDLGGYAFRDDTLYPLTYVDGSVQLFINGAVQEAPEVSSTEPLVIEGIDIPAGGSVIILYSARVNEYAPPCSGFIRNTASIADSCPCAEATDFAETEPVCEPRLSIVKQICPSIINSCSEPVRFTFIIRNTGCCPAMANDDVSITDVFDPPITITSVEFNGTEWEGSGYYTYDGDTGEFTTVPGQITVPAASYARDTMTGAWNITPGESILVITGRFCPGE